MSKNTRPTSSPSATAEDNATGSCLMYVGAYAQTGPRGVYLYRMDLGTGALTPLGLAGEAINPSFLAIDTVRHRLFAVNESGVTFGADNAPVGAVSSFAIDAKTGMLTFLSQVQAPGVCPCHISLDRQGAHVFVSHYVTGNVAVLPVRSDGTLGEPTAIVQHSDASMTAQAGTPAPGPTAAQPRQAHAHSMQIDATGHTALACELGLDRVMVYRYDGRRGKLTPGDPPFTPLPPGAGPRHMAFDPAGRRLYVINEHNSTVTAFAYDPEEGRLTHLQTLTTLPGNFNAKSYTAEVVVHPSGRFLYGSNRGHDSIAMFSIDQRNGMLAPLGQQSTLGKWPRAFAVDPTGRYLVAANQNSNSLVVFAIDADTGRLKPSGQTAEIGGPACVLFVPTGVIAAS